MRRKCSLIKHICDCCKKEIKDKEITDVRFEWRNNLAQSESYVMCKVCRRYLDQLFDPEIIITKQTVEYKPNEAYEP